MKLTRNLLLLALVTQAGACTNLTNNLQDPAIWAKIGKIQERHAIRDYEQNHAIYDLDGDWGFATTAGRHVNTIRHGNGGIMVIPVSGSKPVFYREAGRNLYRSGNNTYHFYSHNHGTWTGGGRSISLQRIN